MSTKIIRSIDALQPQMRAAVAKWQNHLRYEKIPLWINETLRPFARQRELYAQGRTAPGPIVTNAKPGRSYHAFGLALDCYPMDKDGDPIFDFDPHLPPWPRVVQLAKMSGLAWGGDWRTIRDYPHFEWAKAPSLLVCRLRWPFGWRPKGGNQ